jgi:hypothetical protein
MESEETRAAKLLEAQSKAVELFNQIEARGLIRPGITGTRAAIGSSV